MLNESSASSRDNAETETETETATATMSVVCGVYVQLSQECNDHHRKLVKKSLRATLVLFVLVILNSVIQVIRAITYSYPIYVVVPLIQIFLAMVMWWFARSAIKWNETVRCCCGTITRLGMYQFLLWLHLIMSLADLFVRVLTVGTESLALLGVAVNLLFVIVDSVNIYFARQLAADYSLFRTRAEDISNQAMEVEASQSNP